MFLFWLGLGILFSAPVGVATGFRGPLLGPAAALPARGRSHLPGKAAVHHPARPAGTRGRGRALPRRRRPDAGGCYLKGEGPRRGVILFGLEFGSNRWSCRPYCEHLLAAGYDVFAFETRGQGDSDCPPGYEPLQWVTDFEVERRPRGPGLSQSPAGRRPARRRLLRHQQGRRGRPPRRGRRPLRPLLRHRRRVRRLHHAGAVHAPLVPHLQ